jgi:hypothetical protein
MFHAFYAVCICLTFASALIAQESPDSDLLVIDNQSTSQVEKAEIAWGEEAFGRRLHIAADKETYAVGEPIALTITLNNVAESPIKELRTGGTWHLLRDYHVHVVSDGGASMAMTPSMPHHRPIVLEDGREVQMTHFGQNFAMIPARSGNRDWESIVPRESIRATIPLNRIYDLSLAGKYSLKVVNDVRWQFAREGGGVDLNDPQYESLEPNPILGKITSNTITIEIVEPE